MACVVVGGIWFTRARMKDYCLAICGEWCCSETRESEILIDKQRLSVVVAVKEGVSLSGLCDALMGEFIMDKYGCNVMLSYWSRDCMEMTIDIKTMPVLLNSDSVLGYFF